MKKLISLLLAVLMVFSLVTVAFAADEATDAPETENTETVAPGEEEGTESLIPDLGEYDWILDLPFWTVGPALKFAKIALKLVTVYLKVAKIFGLVEKDMDDYIIDLLTGMIKDAENGGTDEPVTEPTTDAGTPEESLDAAA
ncbi:MAG: acid shock protein [Clostridia bacterium]|nr:acid shock protein [Clostridia bacterium]